VLSEVEMTYHVTLTVHKQSEQFSATVDNASTMSVKFSPFTMA